MLEKVVNDSGDRVRDDPSLSFKKFILKKTRRQEMAWSAPWGVISCISPWKLRQASGHRMTFVDMLMVVVWRGRCRMRPAHLERLDFVHHDMVGHPATSRPGGGISLSHVNGG